MSSTRSLQMDPSVLTIDYESICRSNTDDSISTFVFYTEEEDSKGKKNIWDPSYIAKQNPKFIDSPFDANKMFSHEVQEFLYVHGHRTLFYLFKQVQLHSWYYLKTQKVVRPTKSVELANYVKKFVGTAGLRLIKKEFDGFLNFLEKFPDIFHVLRVPKKDMIFYNNFSSVLNDDFFLDEYRFYCSYNMNHWGFNLSKGLNYQTRKRLYAMNFRRF